MAYSWHCWDRLHVQIWQVLEPLHRTPQYTHVHCCSDNGYCGSCPYAPNPTKIDFAAEANKTCESSWGVNLWEGKAQ